MSQEVTIYRRPETYESVNERYVQENVIEKVLVNRIEPLNRELQIFIDCVREGRPFPISQWEATMNLEICERIAQCFSAVKADNRTPSPGHLAESPIVRARRVGARESEIRGPDPAQRKPALALHSMEAR